MVMVGAVCFFLLASSPKVAEAEELHPLPSAGGPQLVSRYATIPFRQTRLEIVSMTTCRGAPVKEKRETGR